MKKLLLSTIAFVVCVIPILFLISGTVKGNDELYYLLSPVIERTGESIEWHLLPQSPTLAHYFQVMIKTPEFWVLFWNSVKIVVLVLAGQFLISILAAWGFAHYQFPGRKILFRIYIFLMLLPFQAKMLSEYLIMDRLQMIDTHWAIILPGVFSTFPVFILYQFFKKIPQEVIESARLDGAGEWTIFTRIAIPLAWNGIVAAAIINFIEYWNIIEQPLVFLKRKRLWPLSMYMPDVLHSDLGAMFVIIILSSIPVLILFLGKRKYLQKGILMVFVLCTIVSWGRYLLSIADVTVTSPQPYMIEDNELCVPIQAIHQESENEYYVYSVVREESMLGENMTAQKVLVNIIDKDDRYAAIEEGSLYSDTDIILTSDKELHQGCPVRVKG